MSVVKLQREVLPAVFARQGLQLVDCETEESKGQDQFMSSVVFLTARVRAGPGHETVDRPLVVKFEPINPDLRNYLKSNIQFHNEVFMYEKVIPFLNRSKICEETFAKFYYGVGKLGKSDESIVVVEDLRPSGFRLTTERVFLDYEHLSLALEKLGRFHALSYAAKNQSPDEFYKLANSLQESSWTGDSTYHHIIKKCFRRPMEHLVQQDRHAELLRRLAERFDDGLVEVMRKLVAPDEPLAVICQGDFCRNNVLFKYSGGRPTDLRFFDVATARYASPAVDISFLLFLNSTRETRLEHWDALLAAYHRALSAAVPGTPVPSLQDLRREMVDKALYGFVHCSFFLPAMMYDNPYQDMETVMNGPAERVAEDYARLGGEHGTRLLADMVEELVERGCISVDHAYMQ